MLIVDGDPRTVRHDDEVFYLEAALRPGDREDSGTSVRVITSEELAGVEPRRRGTAGAIELDEFDVVILANVAALSAERVSALADWVRAGGGILVAPGDHVDPAAYDRTMLPLLPQSLRDPIDTTWGAAPEERDSRALHLVKWEADHPIFRPFSKAAPELADARFFEVSLLGPTTSPDRKVLARFTNGAAALVEASIGAGRTLLFTSTLDRDWNDLPIHPGFLPLMQQAVRHLARKHAAFGDTDHAVGSSVVLPTGDLKKLEVRGPDGIGAVFEGDRLVGRSTVRFGRTDRPGVYRVIGTDQTGSTHERDELAFVVNVDARGSDLTPGPGHRPAPVGHRHRRRPGRRRAPRRAVARARRRGPAAAARRGPAGPALAWRAESDGHRLEKAGNGGDSFCDRLRWRSVPARTAAAGEQREPPIGGEHIAVRRRCVALAHPVVEVEQPDECARQRFGVQPEHVAVVVAGDASALTSLLTRSPRPPKEEIANQGATQRSSASK